MSMKAGIDSSHGMTYTGMISGHSAKINYLYGDLLKEFSKYNVKSLHWRKIPSTTKDRLRNHVVASINNSDIKINIFKHEHIMDFPTKNVILELLPQHISLKLCPWLREIDGEFHLDINDDYNKGSMKTETFIKNLVETINYHCTGKKIDCRPIVKSNGLFLCRSTIRTRKGILEICAHKTDSKFSNSIQIMDMVLGYWVENKAYFNKSKVAFWDIFKK